MRGEREREREGGGGRESKRGREKRNMAMTAMKYLCSLFYLPTRQKVRIHGKSEKREEGEREGEVKRKLVD